MALLSDTSEKALVRLRNYVPPPTHWLEITLTRRAAVLILLFPDRNGELRVVLTIRSPTLRSFSGQAALPGGKAEDGETPFETARREAAEEIGLPIDDHQLPAHFRVEHLCELPIFLSANELAVRPCVAFLHSHDPRSGQYALAADVLRPQMDAREVAAVFSAPFENFLTATDAQSQPDLPGEPGDWYFGYWTEWNKEKWRMHSFFVPTTNQVVRFPKGKGVDGSTAAEMLSAERYRVWGLTAKILVDAVRIAYDRQPEFEHAPHFGDEELIGRLNKTGRLAPRVREGQSLSQDKKDTANL